MVLGQGGRFDGAAALVTGGAHGIGRACAPPRGRRARVAVLDLDEEAAQDVVSQLAPLGERPHLAVRMDVTDRSSVERAVGRAADELGQVDTLVNVAGGDVGHGAFEDTDDEVWARVLELNLLGVVRCCRAAIPHLRPGAMSPAIVTVSSINAFIALGSEAYSAAKAGLTSLTGNLAASLAHDGIRVNACGAGNDQDPGLGHPGRRGGPSHAVVPARARRRARGRGRRHRLPRVTGRGLDHGPHAPGRRRPADRRRQPARRPVTGRSLCGESAQGEQRQQPGRLGRDRVAGGAQVAPGVDHVRILGKVPAQCRGERVVQVRGDVHLRHPGPDGGDQVGVRDTGGAVQHQRHRHPLVDRRDQLQVQLRGPARHRVRGTDGDRQRVDPAVRDELRRGGRVGAYAGGVHAVLAADLAQLRLDADARGVAALHDRAGRGAVGLVTEPRPVVHHRGEAERDSLVHQRLADRVVEVQHARHRRPLRDGCASPARSARASRGSARRSR